MPVPVALPPPASLTSTVTTRSSSIVPVPVALIVNFAVASRAAVASEAVLVAALNPTVAVSLSVIVPEALAVPIETLRPTAVRVLICPSTVSSPSTPRSSATVTITIWDVVVPALKVTTWFATAVKSVPAVAEPLASVSNSTVTFLSTGLLIATVNVWLADSAELAPLSVIEALSLSVIAMPWAIVIPGATARSPPASIVIVAVAFSIMASTRLSS